MEEEVWKDIIGQPGYKVSNYGRVMSFIKDKKGLNIGSKNNMGYITICFGRGTKRVLVHRIVAEHFIPKIEGKNQVNHKNGIRSDNNVMNLEWCNNSENNKHAFDVLKRKPTWLGKSGHLFHETKRINQYNVDGSFIKEWYNARDIFRELKINYRNVSSVCYGRRKTAGGFIFKFKEEE